ncbi:MAG: Sapep family Mn(2+)-dependent dipeptidase [Oscillospiraceae bacterium]|jgi:succinyl-diaminopimelate desuccinylase|nr:Sapep family Mn(2+)-dependent dipeptidase [Oscillospiraceae bacterium]
MIEKYSELLPKLDAWIAENREKLIEDILSAVSIRSVAVPQEGKYPFGEGCAKVLDHILKVSEGYGFATENNEYYCGSATLGGTSGKKSIGIYAHMDVVPEGEGWTKPPYEPWILDDKYIVGRGGSDNKGPALGALYALRFLKEHEIALQNDVRLVFGCAEEIGMPDMDYYTVNVPQPDFSLVPDCGFPVCHGEKGLAKITAEADVSGSNLIDFDAGEVFNIIAAEAQARIGGVSFELASEKLAAEGITVEPNGDGVLIKSVGRSSHAAFPQGSDDAIGKLARALVASGLLTGAAKSAVGFVADSTTDYYGAGLDIPFEDEASGKLTHVLSIIRVKNGRLEINYDIRYPVTTSESDVKPRLESKLRENGFSVTNSSYNAPNYIPLDNPFVPLLTDISNELLGLDLKPYTMGGGTYARKIPNAIGYGPGAFGPGVPKVEPIFPPGRGGGHQPDEALDVGMVLTMIRIYVISLLELDKTLA